MNDSAFIPTRKPHGTGKVPTQIMEYSVRFKHHSVFEEDNNNNQGNDYVVEKSSPRTSMIAGGNSQIHGSANFGGQSQSPVNPSGMVVSHNAISRITNNTNKTYFPPDDAGNSQISGFPQHDQTHKTYFPADQETSKDMHASAANFGKWLHNMSSQLNFGTNIRIPQRKTGVKKHFSLVQSVGPSEVTMDFRHLSGQDDESLAIEEEELVVPRERKTNELVHTLSYFRTSMRSLPRLSTSEVMRDLTWKVNSGGIDREKAGILEKKSEKLFGLAGWTQKYCVLNKRVFNWYKLGHLNSFQGSLNFDLMTCQLKIEGDPQTSNEFHLIPVEFTKIFKFKAQTNEDMLSWYVALEYAIQTSAGFRSKLLKIYEEPKFWKFERMVIKQFLKQVDSGDILLFTSKQGPSGVQRMFTGSRYDHVAMFLISNPPGGQREIFVFEATSNEGVGLCRFEAFLQNNWHEFFERLVYRRLLYKRSPEFYSKLQRFLDHAYGKMYKVSAEKLLKKESLVLDGEDFKDRTFFCSELVAAAYKRLGLLPKERSSTQYWPGSFSMEEDLAMLDGAALSQEYLLDFSPDCNEVIQQNLEYN